MVILAKIIKKINYYLHNSYIPYTAKIGRSSRFAYGGIGVVIHHLAEIGENCMIGQGVTIGGKTGQKGAPIIGNNVVIGANAVVIKDIESNCIVAGIPAQIISKDIKKFKEEGII